MKRLYTKSAFRQALICQTGLYYYSRNDEYANRDSEDEFLRSLAEGGFQVGELAKVYYGISELQTIETLDYDESIERTKEFFLQKDVNIAEAAFRFGDCFVRTDILVKKGQDIQLIEVKAKSWDPSKDSFCHKNDANCVDSGILEYVYDVAFQKYVLTGALKELYPNDNFRVSAFLMMADKSTVADVDGINQKFIISAGPCGKKRTRRTEDAYLLSYSRHLLTAFDVDSLCDKIISGKTMEQHEVLNGNFEDFVANSCKAYIEQRRIWTPLGKKCFQCPFHVKETDSSDLKDGYAECWKHQASFTDSDFKRPLVQELWGLFIKREDMIKAGKYFLSDLTDDDIKRTGKPQYGLSHAVCSKVNFPRNGFEKGATKRGFQR